jgi:hypothetical protein
MWYLRAAAGGIRGWERNLNGVSGGRTAGLRG